MEKAWKFCINVIDGRGEGVQSNCISKWVSCVVILGLHTKEPAEHRFIPALFRLSQLDPAWASLSYPSQHHRCPAWSIRSDQFRSSQIRSGQAGSGQVRSGQVRSGQIRSGQVRSGQVRSGQIRSDQIRSGQVRSGQVRSDQIRSDLTTFNLKTLLHVSTNKSSLFWL